VSNKKAGAPDHVKTSRAPGKFSLFVNRQKSVAISSDNGTIRRLFKLTRIMAMKIRILAALALVVGLAGCATPLNMGQKQELRGYQAKGLAVEEKNPGAAAALGLLPGGGSFYTGNIGPGVVNLLFWPLSILWDPISGYDGALTTNYYASKQAVERKQKKEMSLLEDELISERLTKESYITKKREIDNKYSYD